MIHLVSGDILLSESRAIAHGVGGLDWKEVRPLVERHLGDLGIPICVYETFQPGVVAKEPAAG